MNRSLLLAALVVLAASSGCEGQIFGSSEPGSGSGAGAGSQAGTGGAGGIPWLPGSGGGTATADRCAGVTTANAAPGHYTLRRLTNPEYTNTVQDLLFTKQAPGATFQSSPPGGSGFTNDSAVLTVYPALVTKYYETATALAKEVLASKGVAGGAYGKLVTCTTTQASCAQSTVSNLARRALRRAVTAEDLDATSGLMAVFNAGGSFDQGLSDTIVALLLHPEFVMIPVVGAQSQTAGATFALDDDALAARLSYFLWQSMPDEPLFAAAAAGTLHTPAVLASQVKRMLADPRAAHLKDVLRDELADLSFLARSDFTQLGQSNALRDAMIGETDAFFMDLIKNDKSPLRVLNGKDSFVNKTLADFYGLPFPAGSSPQSFVAVASTRVGLGAQASVLTNTAGGSATFTNPIKRGHWFAKKLFCNEPPPPPANIPPLPATAGGSNTIRDRLAAHVNQPSCVGCHTTMDNFGLGAENYDPFGRWRTTYPGGAAIDATGKYPDGVAFVDSDGLYAELGNQADAKSCMAQQLMKLGLSRTLGSEAEFCVAFAIGQGTVTEAAHFSDLVTSIVTSSPFLRQTGEAP